MEFNHIEWTTPRLESRFNNLNKQEGANWLSEDRKEQIRREMSYIAFEGLMRQAEENKRQEEIGQMEFNYSTFTSQRMEPSRE